MTNDRRIARAIDELFSKLVEGRSPAVSGSNEDFFPLGKEPDAESYWRTRTRRVLTAEDFESLGCETEDELARRLSDLWGDDGIENLEATVRQLIRVSTSLRKREQQEDGEVSPFIYVMY